MMINENIIDIDGNMITDLNEESEQPAVSEKTIESAPFIDSSQAETANEEGSLTAEDYFLFERNFDGRSYSISAKDVETLPSLVTIPSTHNGLPVTVIKENSFAFCSQLSILLFEEPSNIRIIESYAFYHCSGLESIVLPDRVERLCCGAFASCSLLQQVYFESIKPPSLEDGVFYETSEYLLLYVPKHTLSSYLGTPSWQKYKDLIMTSPQTIPTNLGFFLFELNSDGESYSVFAKTEAVLPYYLAIPWYYNQKRVTVIGRYAFWGIKIRDVLIPDTVEKIDNNAFLYGTTRYNPDYIYGESILEHVKFGRNSSLTEIGMVAFGGNLLLREIKLPETLRIIHDHAFFSSGLTEIYIPKSLESMGLRVFYQALNLERITVDHRNLYYKDIDGIMYNLDGTTLIAYPLGKESYSYSLPDTVTDFGIHIFWGNRYLRVLYLNSDTPPAMNSNFSSMLPSFKIYVPDGSYEAYVNAPGWQAYKDIIYKNSIIRNEFAIIGNELIQYVGNAPEIMIPKDIVQIRDYALTSCSALEKILVEEGNISYTSSEGVLFNSHMTKLINYPPARKTTEYEVPSTVTAVGMAAFFDSNGLSVLKVHNQLEAIEDYAFLRCFRLYRLINLDAEDHLARIGIQAFYRCTTIKEVSLLAIQYLASAAFSICSDLNKITLGPDFIDFRGMFLSADTNLTQVDLNVYALIPPKASGFSFSAIKTIHVPAQSAELYKSTPPWSGYSNKIFPLTIPLMK
ncbi:leucine-rich repeat protein [Anoxybacterium hadale]|uniref:Leucine-rich repeat protein n=1 Tax=Anoxybacterium hadale TaxID=3408580 RepID=A0ACD1A8B3_9FIRM|nr:leucine-rich repeat protein [Clostridiales bacterium]